MLLSGYWPAVNAVAGLYPAGPLTEIKLLVVAVAVAVGGAEAIGEAIGEAAGSTGAASAVSR